MNSHAQSNSLLFGIYSIDPKHYELNNMKINHYFTTWHNKELIESRQLITKLSKSNKISMLTVEPWPKFGEDKNQFLTNIISGRYTSNIANLCLYIQANFNGKIIIRWGHEMDLYSTSRYPWATDNSKLFIDAYKKWVDTCKTYTSKVIYMWSPAGNNGNEKYYPGDKYVDYVGFSWYSYPAFEWYTYKRILPFKEIMNWKYNVLTQFKKPIIAAEFGMAEQNKTDVQKNLLNSEQLKKDYPLLHSIVFISEHTESWIPGVISSPDWRINTNFLQKLK